LRAGHVVVSIDYRLAPKTKAGDIAKDVEDACGRPIPRYLLCRRLGKENVFEKKKKAK
jgi:hypothetical protein